MPHCTQKLESTGIWKPQEQQKVLFGSEELPVVGVPQTAQKAELAGIDAEQDLQKMIGCVIG